MKDFEKEQELILEMLDDTNNYEELKEVKGDKKEYKAFFKKAMKKFGVTEPDQLKGSKKKEFFDYVDKGWKSDKEESGDNSE